MLKRKFALLAVLCLIVMSAVPSWGAKSRKEKQPKISDNVFIKMCKSGRARDIRYAIRSKGANINALISAGADINAKDNDGMTALMCAVKWTENPEAVSVLIEAGSPVNLKDKE
ncbi:MAG: ankyrin repeat domain-containing protein, partial [Synergistaceae bacterium]|nr:ankyrin repeat domain-containing protein [Synergistaceae bacterium]